MSGSPDPSFAHQNPFYRDSVAAKDIWYQETTKYNSALDHAVAEWNKVGPVDIYEDEGLTVATLEFHDFDDCDSFVLGSWQWNPGADNIKLNVCLLDATTSDNRSEVVLHEIGHALGFAHSFEGQVMQEIAYCGCTTPQAHDKADYYERWGSEGSGGGGGGLPGLGGGSSGGGGGGNLDRRRANGVAGGHCGGGTPASFDLALGCSWD